MDDFEAKKLLNSLLGYIDKREIAIELARTSKDRVRIIFHTEPKLLYEDFKAGINNTKNNYSRL